MTASSTVWVVTGATRGLGLEFCTQVRSVMGRTRKRGTCYSNSYLEATSAPQILALQHTNVVAGARPGESADELRALSKKYEGRVMIVEVELLNKDSVKVKIVLDLRCLGGGANIKVLKVASECRQLCSRYRTHIHRELTT